MNEQDLTKIYFWVNLQLRVPEVEQNRGITDEQEMKIAISEGRTILTHDSDYGVGKHIEQLQIMKL